MSKTDNERIEAARAIMTSSHSPEALSICLDDWDLFVPYRMPPMDERGEVYDHLWSCYTQLRTHVFEWLVDYQLAGLAARIEALESGAPDFDDHR